MKELFETIWNMPMETFLKILCFAAGGFLLGVVVKIFWLHRQWKQMRGDFEESRNRIQSKLKR